MAKHALESFDAKPMEAEAEKITLTKLAQKHGQWIKTVVGDDEHFTPAHLVASVYHGWSAAHFASGVEPSMTDADYLAAIKIAVDGKVHAGADCRIKKDEVK